MRIENLPYASLANTKYTCCSDKTLIIRDSKNSPARTCHRLPVLQISGRYQCRISSCSLGSSYELRKWFSSATTWRSRSPLLFILNASYHNGNALFCRCPIKKEILLLAALIILAATDGKRDSPCLPDPSWPSSIFGIRPKKLSRHFIHHLLPQLSTFCGFIVAQLIILIRRRPSRPSLSTFHRLGPFPSSQES